MVAKPLCPLYKNIIKPLDRARYPELRSNDTKMFAQADVEPDVNFYGTADVECKKVYDMIKAAEGSLSFRFIDITIPYHQFFGELKFED